MSAILLICTFFAGEAKFAKDFQAHAINFPPREITLKDALATLEKQSGNQVLDLRKVHLSNPKLLLKTHSFWETLDILGKEHGIGFSPYQIDGAIAFVDTPYRKLTTHYSGPFRFAFKRISVTRDDDTQTHYAQLILELAWEPRLRPFYVNLDQAAVAFGKTKQAIARQTMKDVAGGATEIEVRMDAPARKVQKIDSITGTVRVIAAPKMLQVTFDKLKPMATGKARDAQPQDGVSVRLLEVAQPRAKPWQVKLQLAYPEGALVPLQSFQSPFADNRVWLSWYDATTKTMRTLRSSNEQYEPRPNGAHITVAFAPSETTPLPPASANVTLHLRTPSRVAEVTVPFAFRDLPLP